MKLIKQVATENRDTGKLRPLQLSRNHFASSCFMDLVSSCTIRTTTCHVPHKLDTSYGREMWLQKKH